MTHLILIIDHVSQSLIVNHADENVDLHFTTIRTTVHPLCAVEVVPNCNTSIYNTIQPINHPVDGDVKPYYTIPLMMACHRDKPEMLGSFEPQLSKKTTDYEWTEKLVV